MDHSVLPERLFLGEDGQWITPSWAYTNDDDEWTSYGWRARTYEGDTLFHNQSFSVVAKWLADNGYVDTGDGYHYQRRKDG